MAGYSNFTLGQLFDMYVNGYMSVLSGDLQEVLDIVFETGEMK